MGRLNQAGPQLEQLWRLPGGFPPCQYTGKPWESRLPRSSSGTPGRATSSLPAIWPRMPLTLLPTLRKLLILSARLRWQLLKESCQSSNKSTKLQRPIDRLPGITCSRLNCVESLNSFQHLRCGSDVRARKRCLAESRGRASAL